MGRTYAGILGPIAFGVVVVRSLLGGECVESALAAAPMALCAFAAIGYVIGSIADRTIVEAIEIHFHAQLKAEESATAAVTEGPSLASGTQRSA